MMKEELEETEDAENDLGNSCRIRNGDGVWTDCDPVAEAAEDG